MYRAFPVLTDRPAPKTVVGGALYWVVYVVALPFLMLLMMVGGLYSWSIVLLYGISFLAVGAVFFRHLKESFFQVRYDPGRFFSAVGIAAAVVLSVEMILIFFFGRSENANVIWATNGLLPFAEVPLLLGVSASIYELPLLMMVCLTVFVPVTMCCLYYGVGFAPVAAERPWLGYLVVAALAAVPRLAGLGNTGYPLYQLTVYLFQLPWHMCACWAYQKADTIWAPICVYSMVNLLTGLNVILYFRIAI